MSFYERYAECCQRKNIAPVSQAAADMLGCTKANISALAKNATMPRGEVIAGAAKMLDVSADFLLGLTDVPFALRESKQLPAGVKEILLLLQELNEEGQVAALAMVRGLAAQNIYKKCSVSGSAQEVTA